MHRRSAPLLFAALCAVGVAGGADAAEPGGELAAVKAELAATQSELSATRDALEKLASKVDELEAGRGGGSAAAPATAVPSGPRIPAVNVDNPAISFVVDTTFDYDHLAGYDFALQSGELFLSAPVDPFLRAFATINGSSTSGFDIEEAAVVTTSLPWNLTVKAGRFFSDVGRLPHWHDEALPFVDRPPSIERMIGGESEAEGAELTWLAPIEHYVSVTAGLYNGIGADQNEQLRQQGFHGARAFNELTWLLHPSTYFDLTDTLNLEVGGTLATVQQEKQRGLYGIDVTLRHQPGTSGVYQGFVLGGEWYWNSERASDAPIGTDPFTGATLFGTQRFARNAGYAYLETFFNRRFSLGVRGDYAEDPTGPADRQRTYSAFATWFPSEFQRLRLQFDEIVSHTLHDDQRITLQWTAFMGSHSHGFASR